MGFKKLFNYMVCIFISGLGLFNSTQLEVRYESGTNNELLFQNGQIISTAFIGLFLAAFLIEIMMMRRNRASSNHESKITEQDKPTNPKKDDKILIPEEDQSENDAEEDESENDAEEDMI